MVHNGTAMLAGQICPDEFVKKLLTMGYLIPVEDEKEVPKPKEKKLKKVEA